MSVNKEPTLWDKINEFFNNVLVPTTGETFRLLPDALVLGTAVLSALSLSKSYGVLLLAMIELMVLQRIIGTFVGGMTPIQPGDNGMAYICQPGFSSPNKMRISILELVGVPSAFPSPVMFFISGIMAYMIGAMEEFSKEITTLGSDINTRKNVAFVLSILFIFFTLFFRIHYGCETFGPIFISLFVGGLAGYGILKLNKTIFGREYVNILNLPVITQITGLQIMTG